MVPKKQPKATTNPKRRSGVTKSKIRKGWDALTPTGKVAVGAAGAAAAIGLAAGGSAIATKHFAPENVARRAETKAMVQEARAGDFHNYDRIAIERKLKRASPTITQHWDRITRIAGSNYNSLAVLDTLSRVPGGVDHLGTEITEQQNARSSRANRKIEILRRVQTLAAEDPEGTRAMLDDLYGLRSSDFERIRHTYYGTTRENWQYGRIISGSHTNFPAKSIPKDKKVKQLDPKSARLKAKGRNSR